MIKYHYYVSAQIESRRIRFIRLEGTGEEEYFEGSYMPDIDSIHSVIAPIRFWQICCSAFSDYGMR